MYFLFLNQLKSNILTTRLFFENTLRVPSFKLTHIQELMRVVIISTYLPRKCGIATFTADLYRSLTSTDNIIDVIALSDSTEERFPKEVVSVIQKDDPSSYMQQASFINDNYDICVIQHEYGIFGGDTGDFILNFVSAIQISLITNFHTILQKPSIKERSIIGNLARKSTFVSVMTKRAVDMLTQSYEVPHSKIVLIPHGVPAFDFDQKAAKEQLLLSGKKVLLSFGFLGSNKGIETVLEAIENIKDKDFIYIILGTTHPNVLKHEGEKYREGLVQKCTDLQITDKVLFVNEFASDQLLKTYLTACDIFITAYPNANQISSGTLSFAIGAGAAVISTPYLYALDLLSDNRGILFDFGDSNQLSTIIIKLLDDDSLLQQYRHAAKAYGISIQWSDVGKKHLSLITKAINKHNNILHGA